MIICRCNEVETVIAAVHKMENIMNNLHTSSITGDHQSSLSSGPNNHTQIHIQKQTQISFREETDELLKEDISVFGWKISRKRWTITLYSLSIIALYADQNIMAPNLSAIANEFGFSDEERDTKLGGDIALAFFALGAISSLAIGFLTDVIDGKNRSKLFALMIILGEGSCLAVYFVQTFNELFICRALTGLSVGAAPPLIYSVVGDMYPSDERNSIAGIISVGQGVGIGVGQVLSGFLGRYGWRIPFLAIAIPSLCTACTLI